MHVYSTVVNKLYWLFTFYNIEVKKERGRKCQSLSSGMKGRLR